MRSAISFYAIVTIIQVSYKKQACNYKMLTKCQSYLIFNWEELILINFLMDQELAFTTSAFISTDNLETFYAKKIPM